LPANETLITPDPELVAQYAKLTPEKRAEMIAEREALLKQQRSAIEEAYRLWPHLKYQPNPAQYRWLQMIQKGLDEGKQKFGVFDGNSSGKTYWLVQLMHAIMCPAQSRNPWFNRPFIDNWKWGKNLRLVCKATDLTDQTGMVWQLINAIWSMSDFETSKQDHGYVAMYKHKHTGFVVSVRTFDQPVEQHDDGGTYAAVFVNEPCPTYVWNAYPARLREGGFMLATATLVRESAFFKDDVMDNPNAVFSMGDLEGNCREHSTLEVTHPMTKQPVTLRGTLEHANLENIIKNSPAHEREARKTGRPVHLSGAAFSVTPEVHFVTRDKSPTIGTNYLFLDPHKRKPWCMIVGRVDAEGNRTVIDEWPRLSTEPWTIYAHKISNVDYGIGKYAAIIKELQQRHKVFESIIDARFAASHNTHEGFSMSLRNELAWNHQLYFQDGNTKVRGSEGGEDKLKEELYFDRSKPVDFHNSPGLYIVHEDCRNVCYQLTNVTYHEKASPDAYGVSEKLDEDKYDFIRLLEYFVMHDCRYVKDPVRTEPRTDIDLQQEKKALRRVFSEDAEPVHAEDLILA